jgi:hypothetical protein
MNAISQEPVNNGLAGSPDPNEAREGASPQAPLSVVGLLQIARVHWLMLLITVCVGTVLALLFVALVPPRYVAHTFIAPNQDMEAPLGQLQQFTSLLGGSLGSGSASLSEFTAVMQSRATAEALVRDTDVLQRLYANQWDAQTRRWKPATGAVAALRRVVYEDLLGIPLPLPGPDLLVEHIKEKVQALPSKKNPGLIEISYESRDASFSLFFLSSLMRASEATLLQRYKELNDATVRYATREAEQSHPVDVRQALESLLVKELRRAITLGSGHLDTMRVVMLPEVSQIGKRPSLVVSILLFNLIGVLFVLTGLVLRAGLRRTDAT